MSRYKYLIRKSTGKDAISIGQAIALAIRKEFPNVYHVIGVGWCGPQWQKATAREKELQAVLKV